MTGSETSRFTPTPSVERMASTAIDVADTAPSAATAIGVPVASDGEVPSALGITRERLAAAGFDGALGSAMAVLLIPRYFPF